MAKLSDSDISVLKLILRSPNHGAGWRHVSEQLWFIIEEFERKELLEIKPLMVRFSERGLVVIDYI
jgi:hypothetical protein